ncbi:CamS family sex pheromone protein [Bacillus sp. FJAT-45350]|uniref:CamS family sex pheromone protein n=1 Tax=Bacillus sp. FJAT-45350 TaxID=2011014 RepID=UPI000BB74B92|nr:CamS family sex pheromone protein [Bacillus sp. FJAT-45350]
MIKRISAVVLSSVFLLSGCLPFIGSEEELIEVEEHEQEQLVELSPQIYTQENYYRSVLYEGVYTHGEARGFSNAVVYNRFDLEQLEMGLMGLANERFSPEQYFFREGQYIEKDELNSWLIRYHEENNPAGINPPLGDGETLREREESQPRYLSHILEHNYLVENENGNLELGGIVVGLSLNSVYHFRVEDDQGRYHFYSKQLDPQKVEAEGRRMASEVVSRLREVNRENGVLENVPIIVALFMEQEQNSVIPGTFFAKGVAEPAREIGNWQRINERYYLFPSRDATAEQRNDAERFMKLKEEIEGFFDNFIGVVGKGYYKNEQLHELTIEVPIRYYGKAEVIALTQYVADRITQRFPNSLKVQVYITSVAGNESIIIRNPNEEPIIHIYR